MPTPTHKTMTFFDALSAVASGKKITKLEWNNAAYYGVLKEGRLLLHKPEDNQLHPWIISDGDLLGTDWIVLDAPEIMN